MTTEALTLFEPQALTVPSTLSESIQTWLEYVRSKQVDGGIPYNPIGQKLAVDVATTESVANAFLSDYQKAAEAWRKVDYDRFKAKKSASDEAIMELSAAVGELHSQLLDHEREKVRVERAINEQREREAREKAAAEAEIARQAELERQRQERAERERLAQLERAAQAEQNAALKASLEKAADIERMKQAEASGERLSARVAEAQRLEVVSNVVPFEAPKTEGLTAKVSWEFDVENKEQFARWCWDNGRSHWVRMLEFGKRDVMEYLNGEGANRNIPGIRVYQAIGAAVKRTKPKRDITVESQRREL